MANFVWLTLTWLSLSCWGRNGISYWDGKLLGRQGREVPSPSDSQFSAVSSFAISNSSSCGCHRAEMWLFHVWVLKNGHKFVDTLPVKRWSPCPSTWNLDSPVMTLTSSQITRKWHHVSPMARSQKATQILLEGSSLWHSPVEPRHHAARSLSHTERPHVGASVCWSTRGAQTLSHSGSGIGHESAGDSRCVGPQPFEPSQMRLWTPWSRDKPPLLYSAQCPDPQHLWA